jgi:hypothetical protein
MFVALAVAGVVVYRAGEPAEDAVEHLAGVCEPILQSHEEATLVATVLPAALGELVASRRRPAGQDAAPGGSDCLLLLRMVRRPVASGMRKRGSGQSSQEVCPHNSPKLVRLTREEAFWPRQRVHGEKLVELMAMTREEFSRRFKSSPVKRTKRRGLLRNVAIALGNRGSPEAVPVLKAAIDDDEPLIRGHAAWALGRIGTPDALDALRGREGVEEDAWVREEIWLALAG